MKEYSMFYDFLVFLLGFYFSRRGRWSRKIVYFHVLVSLDYEKHVFTIPLACLYVSPAQKLFYLGKPNFSWKIGLPSGEVC